MSDSELGPSGEFDTYEQWVEATYDVLKTSELPTVEHSQYQQTFDYVKEGTHISLAIIDERSMDCDPNAWTLVETQQKPKISAVYEHMYRFGSFRKPLLQSVELHTESRPQLVETAERPIDDEDAKKLKEIMKRFSEHFLIATEQQQAEIDRLVTMNVSKFERLSRLAKTALARTVAVILEGGSSYFKK